jgi:hypothetical protein
MIQQVSLICIVLAKSAAASGWLIGLAFGLHIVFAGFSRWMIAADWNQPLIRAICVFVNIGFICSCLLYAMAADPSHAWNVLVADNPASRLYALYLSRVLVGLAGAHSILMHMMAQKITPKCEYSIVKKKRGIYPKCSSRCRCSISFFFLYYDYCHGMPAVIVLLLSLYSRM